jgi:hypothetical protein
MNGYWLGSVSNTIESGGDISLIAEGDIIGTAANVDLTATTQMNLTGDTVNLIAPNGAEVTTDGVTEGTIRTANVSSVGDLRLLAGGGDVYLNSTAVGVGPRLLFRDSAGTFYGGLRMEGANVFKFYNGSTSNDYAYIYAERIYAMDGTTASRYMFDNGTQTAFSGAVLTGTLTSTGVVTGDNFTGTTITGTTATTNAAIWVLTSGTTYNLRRNTSSARYKTNITDADDAVLEAARKIRPRHYESTIEDEAGTTRLGFIAEEVLEAGLSHAVGYDAEGRVETLDTTALIAALFVRINDLEQRLADLESR